MVKESFIFKGKSCQVIHLAIILFKLCLNFQNSKPKNWVNSCRGVGLGCIPLTWVNFLKPMRFSLDTGFHNFGHKLPVNP